MKILVYKSVKIIRSPGIWFLLVALLSAFGARIAHGQTVNMGTSLNGMVSGSGLGPSLSPQLNINTERSLFGFGVNIQNRNSNLSGLRGRYEFIFNPDESMEVFLFYDIAYHKRAYLGNQVISWESYLNPEFADYYKKTMVKRIEQHAGFGMNVLIAGSLKAFGGIGAGFYNTSGIENRNLFQYRELNDCSLMLMAGIKINIKKIK